MPNERNEPRRGILSGVSERVEMEGRLSRIESTLGDMRTELGDMRTDVDIKQRESRTSIHGLRNQHQEMIDRSHERANDLAEMLGQLKSLPAAIERLTGKFESRCKDIEDNVIDVRLKMAKAMGWAAAAGSISSAAFELVHMIMRGH